MRRPASRPGAASTRPLPPRPDVAMRVEHEYERRGAWAYLAAWMSVAPEFFGRCERKTGIVPFDRLVGQVMGQDALPLGSPGVLDHGQWLLPSRASAASAATRCAYPPSFRSTARSTPVGSTKSKSTSRSFSERCSPRTTFPILGRGGATPGRVRALTTRRLPTRSNGNSPVTTSLTSLQQLGRHDSRPVAALAA